MRTALRNISLIVIGVVLGCTLAFSVPALADDDHDDNGVFIALETLADVIPHLLNHNDRLLAMEAEHTEILQRLTELEAGGIGTIIELCNGCIVDGAR